MAYTPKQLQDNQDEQGKGPYAPMGPTVSAPALGSTPSVGGTVAGQAFVNQPPSQAAGKTPGTGFVNIDKYLGANENAGKDLQASANTTLEKEKGSFRGAAQDFKNQMSRGASGTQIDVNGIINNVLAKPVVAAPKTPSVIGESSWEGVQSQEDIDKAKAAAQADADKKSQAGVEAAKKALASGYTGPTQFGYDVGNTEQMKQLAALGNAQTAGAQLAQQGGALARYNPALSAIDQALYGNQQAALQNINKARSDQMTTESSNKATLEKKAAGIAKKNEDQKAALRQQLGAGAQGILSQAEQQASAARNQESQAMQNAAAAGQQWQAGNAPGGAQATQFLSGSDVGTLNNIGALLGDQSLSGMKAGNAYQAGMATPGPNTAPPKPVTDPYAGLTPDQAAAMKKYQGLGYGDAEAKQAATKQWGAY